MGFKPKGLKKEWYFNDVSRWGKRLKYAGSSEVLSSVIADFRKLGCIRSGKSIAALEQIILNLVFINQVSESSSCMDILIGNKNTGRGSISFDTYGCTAEILSEIVKGLFGAKLICYKKGVAPNKQSKGHSSKIKLTDSGLSIVKDRLKPELIIPDSQPVRCKNISGENLKPAPSYDGTNKRKKVLKYNELLIKSSISVGGVELLAPEKTVFRQFANTTCTEGGRLYGAIYQRFPKDLRKGILLDGLNTVEVDICSTHPLLAYASSGIDITEKRVSFGGIGIGDDPYKTSSLAPNWPEARGLVKSIVVRMLNTKRPVGKSDQEYAEIIERNFWSVRARSEAENTSLKREMAGYKQEWSYEPQYDEGGHEVGYIAREDFSFDIAEIVLDLLHRHWRIGDWFGASAWKRLDYTESRILMRVLEYFSGKSIPAISLHDSVRIAAKHAEELVDVYVKAISDVTGLSFARPHMLLSVDEGASPLGKMELLEALRKARKTDKLLDYSNKYF